MPDVVGVFNGAAFNGSASASPGTPARVGPTIFASTAEPAAPSKVLPDPLASTAEPA
jgi:hypothetical protein